MKNIMKEAHNLTKKIIRKGDSYRATFRICLSFVHSQIKKGVDKIERTVEEVLLNNGYRVWEGYGKKRIYLNNFVELANKFGVELQNPKSYMAIKMYYDLSVDSFFTERATSSSRKEAVSNVISAIRNK